MKQLLSFIFVFILASQIATAQQVFEISGTITSESGKLLEGATVYLHETRRGAITNDSGIFRITNVMPGTYHLHVSFIGYSNTARTIHIRNSNITESFILKPSSLELNEILVEATPWKTENREQSITVEIIGNDFLNKNRDITLMRTLDKLPGISSMNIGAGLSKPVIRGLGTDRVVVAENGIKQQGQQWGTDHGLEMDPFNAERIELIKGPAAVMYGSDAIGGVINIRPPVMPQQDQVEAGILLSGRSNNDLVASSAFASVNKNRKYFHARVSVQDFGDYRVPADSFTYNRYRLPIYENRLKNTAGNEQSVSVIAGLARDWGISTFNISNVNQQAGFFSGAFGIPRSNSLRHDGNFRNIDLPNQQINHFKIINNTNIRLGRNWLDADIGYQNNQRKENAVPHGHAGSTLPDHNLVLGLNLQTISGNFRYHFQKTRNYSAVYGISAQYQQNRIDGYEFLVPENNNLQAGAFSYQQIKVSDKFFVNAGLRFDVVTQEVLEHKILKANNGGYRVNVPHTLLNYEIVSGGAGFSWLPAEHLNVKLNLGSGFRSPNIAELASDGVHHGTFRHEKGDMNLDAERNYQADLNLTFQKSKIIARFTPFVSYFSNFIFLNPSGMFSELQEAGQVYQYSQARALQTGGEFYTDFHLWDEWHFGIGADFVWAQNLDTYRPLPHTPPASIIADLEYDFATTLPLVSGLFVKLTAQAFAPQNRVTVNEPSTPAYRLLHLVTGFELPILGKPLDFQFGVNNLFNTYHYDHLSRYRILNLPEAGRSYHLTVKVPFQKSL